MNGLSTGLTLMILIVYLFNTASTEKCRADDEGHSIECTGNKRCCTRNGKPDCCTTTNMTLGGMIIMVLIIIVVVGATCCAFYYCCKYSSKRMLARRNGVIERAGRDADTASINSGIRLIKTEAVDHPSSSIMEPPPPYSNTDVLPSYSEIDP